MIGGKQEINYPDWCIDQWGSVLHEMLHALGFFHEQSSTNRDDYVTIVWDNIEAGNKSKLNLFRAEKSWWRMRLLRNEIIQQEIVNYEKE